VQNWPHDDQDAGRQCILHAPQCGTHMTTKPVDCVFYTCNTPIHARVPTQEQLAAWFRLLAEQYPNSLERFEALIGKEPFENSPGNA